MMFDSALLKLIIRQQQGETHRQGVRQFAPVAAL
jgi:hypothetical protein